MHELPCHVLVSFSGGRWRATAHTPCCVLLTTRFDGSVTLSNIIIKPSEPGPHMVNRGISPRLGILTFLFGESGSSVLCLLLLIMLD
jgi:hypothetical protein